MLFLRSEEKNKAQVEYIVQKPTRPGKLVVDACGGTYAVFKACMLLINNRRFIGCEVRSDSVTEAMPQLTLLYPRQILSKKSYID